MELQEFDLEELIEKSKEEYPDRKPTEEELKKIVSPIVAVAGLGVGEALALAALLFAMWSHYNPRLDKSAAICKKIHEGKKCGKKFIESEKTDEFITLWCIRKHETKLRIKKT